MATLIAAPKARSQGSILVGCQLGHTLPPWPGALLVVCLARVSWCCPCSGHGLSLLASALYPLLLSSGDLRQLSFPPRRWGSCFPWAVGMRGRGLPSFLPSFLFQVLFQNSPRNGRQRRCGWSRGSQPSGSPGTGLVLCMPCLSGTVLLARGCLWQPETNSREHRGLPLQRLQSLPISHHQGRGQISRAGTCHGGGGGGGR